MTWLQDYTADAFEHAGVPVRIMYDVDARNPYAEFEFASSLLVSSSVRRSYDIGEPYPFGDGTGYGEPYSSAVACRWLTLFGGYVLAVPFELQDYGSNGARVYLTDPDDSPASGGYLVVERHKAEFEFLPTDRLYAFLDAGERREFYATAERCARAEFGEFAHYVAGETFGYIVGEGSGDEDSCWGFYGETYVLEQARESAEYLAGERARLRALPWLPTFGNRIGERVTS